MWLLVRQYLTSTIQSVKNGTLSGEATPVLLVHQAIPQLAHEQKIKTEIIELVRKIHDELQLNTDPKYTSSSKIRVFVINEPSREHFVGARSNKVHKF